MNKTPVNNISKVILKSTNVATEKLLKDAGNKLFNVILENEPEKVDVNDEGAQDANVAVSVDHGSVEVILKIWSSFCNINIDRRSFGI